MSFSRFRSAFVNVLPYCARHQTTAFLSTKKLPTCLKLSAVRCAQTQPICPTDPGSHQTNIAGHKMQSGEICWRAGALFRDALALQLHNPALRNCQYWIGWLEAGSERWGLRKSRTSERLKRTANIKSNCPLRWSRISGQQQRAQLKENPLQHKAVRERWRRWEARARQNRCWPACLFHSHTPHPEHSPKVADILQCIGSGKIYGCLFMICWILRRFAGCCSSSSSSRNSTWFSRFAFALLRFIRSVSVEWRHFQVQL